jgi:hypothetical protein
LLPASLCRRQQKKTSDAIDRDDEGVVGTLNDGAESSDEVVINELLSNVSFYRNRSNVDALRRTEL